jgi:hypothetical protein
METREGANEVRLTLLSFPMLEKVVDHPLFVPGFTSSYHYIIFGLATCPNSLALPLPHPSLLPYQPCLQLRACTQNWSKLIIMGLS